MLVCDRPCLEISHICEEARALHGIFEDNCSKCKMDFHGLIEKFIANTQHLEAKVVYLRYSLSKLLPALDGEMLRCDIFSDLSGCYYFQPAYQEYIEKYYDGHDPMDSKQYSNLLMKISRGKKAVNL